ncbi:MAG: MBOAT family O-acyltransferase [Ginsengibacter sp.]
MGLIQGIGTLVLFKYYNFFVDSFDEAFGRFHVNIRIETLQVIIPLGLSYYTFKMISYLLDINRGAIKATTNWVTFFAYVAFFPCLLAGPIDRAKSFIPQLEKRREFDYSIIVDGMRQVLWGLFKKVVIADNCATITNEIFNNYQHLSSSTLLSGAFFYTIQIYADFSGYSDMAIGIGHMLGFDVTKNFNFPFFSKNIAEFWRRWHISLTSWLTDYIFTPLSVTFRDLGKTGLILAIVLNFTIVGLWHGANWTYVVFGFLHGCYFIPLILKGSLNKKRKKTNGTLWHPFFQTFNVLATFILVMLTFILFRSDNILQAIEYYHRLFSLSFFSNPAIISENFDENVVLFFIFCMLIVEWIQRRKKHGLQLNINWPVFRWAIYACIIFIIGMFMKTSEMPFIYFNF